MRVEWHFTQCALLHRNLLAFSGEISFGQLGQSCKSFRRRRRLLLFYKGLSQIEAPFPVFICKPLRELFGLIDSLFLKLIAHGG